ncbi:hypothetical protein RSAG8_03033, partial [Rhizoctonia solani AG-8 WAC10335]
MNIGLELKVASLNPTLPGPKYTQTQTPYNRLSKEPRFGWTYFVRDERGLLHRIFQSYSANSHSRYKGSASSKLSKLAQPQHNPLTIPSQATDPIYIGIKSSIGRHMQSP